MAASSPSEPASRTADPIVIASTGFAAWMAARQVSLALTTYQAGRLVLVGRKPDGALRVHERMIEQCQGLWTDGRTLWASAKAVLWRFENILSPGVVTDRGVDRRFAPREGRVTGAIDIHDIAMGDVGDGRRGPIFVVTSHNCLATISESGSFRPLWHPPFVSGIVGEDRCHLNGMAMDGDRPAFATAVSRSDAAAAWREHRRDGGLVIDVASGETVAAGLSMPHSPRLHRGRLWLLNSGRGELGWIDPADGRFTPVAFCPGYARGLAFIDRFAVVGLSRPRENQTFEGLELQDRLEAKGAAPRCGLIVIDIDTGLTVEWLRFEHSIDELYDVATLPGVAQAEAIGFVGEDINRTVVVEGPGGALS